MDVKNNKINVMETTLKGHYSQDLLSIEDLK